MVVGPRNLPVQRQAILVIRRYQAVDLLALRERDPIGVAHRDEAIVGQSYGPAHIIAPQLLAMALPHAFAQGGQGWRIDLKIGLGLRRRRRYVGGKLERKRRARKEL
jgi:hypothetical protein